MTQRDKELNRDREWGPETIKRTQPGKQGEQATPRGQAEDKGPARGAGTGPRLRSKKPTRDQGQRAKGGARTGGARTAGPIGTEGREAGRRTG